MNCRAFVGENLPPGEGATSFEFLKNDHLLALACILRSILPLFEPMVSYHFDTAGALCCLRPLTTHLHFGLCVRPICGEAVPMRAHHQLFVMVKFLFPKFITTTR